VEEKSPTSKLNLGRCVVLYCVELKDSAYRRITQPIRKESEGNAKTIVRVHQRADQIQTSYKTLKGVGMFIVASLTAVGAWFGISNK